MEIRLSSQEQEDLVIKNQKLVHYLVNKLDIPPSDYNDIVSIGTIGLIKAAATFNDSANIQFSTYACRCIQNEILMHFRKEKSHQNDISLSSIIINDTGDDEIELGELIEDPDGDFEERIAENEMFEKVISIILNFLTPKERFIILHEISGTNKRDTAKALNVSASYITQLVRRIKQKITLCFKNNEQFAEVFKMKILKTSYRISFFYQNIPKFDNFFAALSQNSTSSENLPGFKVCCNKERIIIRVPAQPESFAFIAQILQQIEDWNMTFPSDKNT